MNHDFRFGYASGAEPGKILASPIASIRILVALWFILALASFAAHAETAPQKAYVLGVFPHLPPRELEKVFAPIAADLSKAVGRTVLFRSSSTYVKFMGNLDNEDYDIVFVQPFDYVVAADRHGYIPLATRDEPLETLVVVQKGSPITKLEDLRGKKIALPPKVAAVSYLLRAHLQKKGIKPGRDVSLSYHRSHVSCMQQVIIGAADACATAAPALRFFANKMKVEMVIIDRTTSIPHTLFAVHPRVPKADRDRLLQTILSWGQSKQGRQLLQRGRLKPFIRVTDEDYDIVRESSKVLK
jgi:phosphonate transport system substrate-binding protein